MELKKSTIKPFNQILSMSRRDRILLIEDMYDAALKIKRYTEGMDYDLFLKDDKTIDAVGASLQLVLPH